MPEKPLLCRGPVVRAILEGRQTQDRRPLKYQPTFVEPNNSPGVTIYENGKPITRWFHFEYNVSLLIERKRLRLKHISPNIMTHSWSEGEVITGLSPYQVGDLLYVRESFSAWFGMCHWYHLVPETRDPKNLSNLFYRATHYYPDDDQKWVSAIHMPKKYARIWLEVTRAWVERIRDISWDDAGKEGWPGPQTDCEEYEGAIGWFKHSWEILYPGSWERNDWVSPIEFRRIDHVV